MTEINIIGRVDCKVEARILRGISSYVAVRMNTDRGDTQITLTLDAEEAEALGCKLLSAATAINGRPPLDKSTALDAGAAAV